MKKISIIYWSCTGNTEAMANLIAQGAKENGNDVKLLNVSEASESDATEADILVLGSPAMGCENIDEYEMEPFVESISSMLAGKPVLLFGSYDWGDGEFIENWANTMREYDANVIGTLIVNMTPEDEDITKCIEAGKSL